MAIWTDAETALLGTAFDRVIAKKLGRTSKAVERKRHDLGIAPFHNHQRVWTKRELALLGKLSDAKVARRLGICRRAVLMQRKRLGIACANPRNRPKHLGQIEEFP